MADSDLDILATLHGPARDAHPLPAADADAMARRVPPALIDFWKRHGIGIYADGMLHLCNPRRYDGLLPLLVGNDGEIHAKDLALYAFSAFGELFLWHQRFGGVEINLMSGDVAAAGYLAPDTIGDPDLDLEARLVTFDRDLYDAKDETGRPLFDRAVSALGELRLDECFGFVPALALGGAPNLANLRRVAALEHFAILAQAAPLTLKDYSAFPPREVRPIG
jgi:hypothetical protein